MNLDAERERLLILNQNCGPQGHRGLQDMLANLVKAQAKELARQRWAMKRVGNVYSRLWDRVDGCLVVMPERVAETDRAFESLFFALGEPLRDQDGNPQGAPDDAVLALGKGS